MKQFLALIALIFLFSACTPKKDDPRVNPMGGGGVDVGNLTAAAIPNTNATVSIMGWKSNVSGNALIVKNEHGSELEFKRSEITELASPNALSLQMYLNSRFPDRDYKIININGLEGVRADIGKSNSESNSDIFLISEQKDFLHIQSRLSSKESGISEGEKIILTVRVKYLGVPYENSPNKTVVLKSRNNSNTNDYAYSLAGDCFYYKGECTTNNRVVSIGYDRYLQIGLAGYDHGRIVELGSETEVPYENIRIEGDYLIGPISKTSISDIYTVFTPKSLKPDNGYGDLKAGYVYLIRTISWPDEDLVTKVRVDKLDSDSITLTYQKLAYVKQAELQKQIDQLNAFTEKYEKPLSEGEVTLYNRATYKNYYYASFNFEYSTSGNMFITHNGWDLTFQTGCSGKPSFTVPHTGSALGDIVDLGKKSLTSVTRGDFPDPNLYKRDCGTEIKVGNTYGIYHHIYSEEVGTTIAAVQVLDMAVDASWVRLKFRRIHMGKGEHFQKWEQLAFPAEIQTVKLEAEGRKSSFFIFDNLRGDAPTSYHSDYFSWNPESSYLSIDDRPYGNEKGFYNLGKNVRLEDVNLETVKSVSGKFVRFLWYEQDQRAEKFEVGDIIVINAENYYNKAIVAMRVESIEQNKSMTISVRYLDRAHAPYAEKVQ